MPNGRVTGGYVLKQLVADGLLATSDAERFKISGGRDRAGHPLVNLAEMNYRTPNAERKLLDLEMLTHWLAQKASPAVLTTSIRCASTSRASPK